jgi:2-methylcitrate dehydratase PrpD
MHWMNTHEPEVPGATSAPAGLLATLGRFVYATPVERIPTTIMLKAKICLLHNLGVAIAGRAAERYAWRLVRRRYSAAQEATLIYDCSRADAEGAALANAVLIHARTQDDAHTPSSTHPGATVTPAALAVAEAEGRSGAEFLAALVLGYEMQGRIGRDYDTITTPRGFRATTIFGVFGAAAASARLMRLTAAQTTSALAFAANLASGLGRTWIEGTDEWRFQVGIAARNGVLAARIAAESPSTASLTLEGGAGFYAAFGGTAEHAPAAIEGLGGRWVLDEVTLKPYPVCAIHQAPVRLAIDIAAEADLRPQDISEVVLELNPYEARFPGIDYAGPFAQQGATLMSAQFCLATALVHRGVTLRAMLEFDDACVNTLLARVRIVANEALPIQMSRVTVTTVGGARHQRAGGATPAASHPDFDETAQWLQALLAREGGDATVAQRLAATIHELEHEPDLRRLVECFAS